MYLCPILARSSLPDPCPRHNLFIAFLYNLGVLYGTHLLRLQGATDLHFLGHHSLRPERRDRNLCIRRHLDALDAVGIHQLHLVH
jgi:hypothetical protein